jgi:hypothetical protein
MKTLFDTTKAACYQQEATSAVTQILYSIRVAS